MGERRTIGRPTGRAGLAAVMAAALLGTGCLGPSALQATRLKYNEAVRVTNDEQLLMNIVRLRYADSPIFIDLPSITSQFEVAGTLGFLGGWGNQSPNASYLGNGELSARDSPTLSFRPREGKDVSRILLTPISAELLSVVNAGANLEQLLITVIDEINDVTNAPQATVMVPRAPDFNDEYVRGIRVLADLFQRGGAELKIGSQVEESRASDAATTTEISGDDLLNAAKEGYVYRHRGDGRYALLKRDKGLVLRFRPGFEDSPEALEFERVFRLRPGLGSYRVKSDLMENALDAPKPFDDGEETVYLHMRSILQILLFLSKGVCVPVEHVETGVAPSTPGPDGRPFDWTRATAGNFFVRSSRRRPRDPEVAVRYRDHWFYIARDDVNSRSILAIIEILVSLEDSESHGAFAPMLTLPVGL